MNMKKFVWLLVLIAVFSFVQIAQSQNVGLNPPQNPAIELFVSAINSRINNLTTEILASSFVTDDTAFCIKNPKDEWNRAFNFTSDWSFVSSCAQKLGDFSGRVCTAAEVKFYFGNFFERGSGSASFLNPNVNCNRTSWVSGCEPGWASTLAPGEPIDIQELNNIPDRTLDSRPCCEGFFCPRGITCMIPCPLGAYCPVATLNEQTGVCEPYNYQLPPANPNHTCGGANTWADVGSSSQIFCQAGSYCPSTVQNLTCHKGHYCQMGSTSVKPCYKLTSCDPTNQNIRAYGIILIVGLSTVLLIIYNFSDQVLSIRERRHAKTRERAAKVVKEKVQAHARWKSAKDAVKRNAMALQSQMSRTFSRKRSISNIEESSMLQENTADSDEYIVAPLHGNNSTTNMVSEQTNTIEPMKGYHDIEESSDSYNSFSFEVEQKPTNKKVPKKKHMHTQAQIFNYAYSQLEKEKALQQQHDNLTFSGVIKLATNNESRKRPTIEVSFKDLTVTLKGKNKNLLRCVTGKLMPGHITAVMGPSGAGKTTFLSALAGKTVGCTMTGHVLINGKKDPISSYKKIIGFVPQDDIVHGNLTVEENLWFSARCRLSANLPKEDKVLIVERTIESLGLQAVRDSLVGTVEKRGISGGQRKRVNVGLEMVMEPSLLILDEPTSGLDSSSSQLLLRALRQEALAGVNICMVLHQPSYSLFKMFDDLILLAKGGLTAYHGPVSTVEEYFAGLGIIVPDRVNPPDHFIDFLEGMVKSSSSSVVSYKELPLRWMLHKNYPVPADMQQDGVGNGLTSEGNGDHTPRIGSAVDTEASDQSFAGEVWQDMVRHLQVKRDVIHQNFLSSHDQSNRRTPGILHQYKYFLGRIGKQRLRDSNVQAIDYLILLLAGACLGSISKVNQNFGVQDYTFTIIAVSLLCKIAALRTFSLDKLEYWRERSSGISSLAHFLAKDTIDHFNTVVKPLVYLSMFYFFSNPRSTFLDNYIILLSLVYCVTGIGYVLAIYLQPGPSQLSAVLLPVVFTLISTQTGGGKLMKEISYMCYPRWALEGFIVSNAERYYGVWLITRCGALMKMGYNVQRWGRCIAILMLTGFGSRVVAFLGLAMIGKK